MNTLYRFFDANGVLLYVGLTVNPGRRMEKHKATQPWWADVARVEMEQHPDLATLRAAEREAIEAEKPLHNIRMNGQTSAPGSLTWICDVCETPVDDGEGYVTVAYTDIRAYQQWHREFDERLAQRAKPGRLTCYTLSELDDAPNPAHWKVLHEACDPDVESSDYWYEISRMRTYPDLLERTAHLTSKTWFQATDWRHILRRAAA